MRRPLIHVGYIKTGSTWLQDAVFADPRSGLVLPGAAPRADLVAELVTCNPYAFDAASARALFDRRVLESNAGDRIPAWSEETLLGDPLVRRYDGRAVCDRIAAVFPEARILICIREQKAMAVSMYREHVKQGTSHGFQMFIGAGDEARSFTPILRPDFLEYHHAISYYQAAFGTENVLVLPQEMLARDRKAFLARLTEFCGASHFDPDEPVRANIGAAGASLALKRMLNRLVVRDPLRSRQKAGFRAVSRIAGLADRIAPAGVNRRIEQRWKDLAGARYAGLYGASNRWTAELIGVDLAAYGYDVR